MKTYPTANEARRAMMRLREKELRKKKARK